ncbi:MAG: ABC transporter permease [Planctomycetes bacterium]|nr:ABC transporter permease [Planctomycetota bacterium]
MSLLTLVRRNLLRHPVRSLLTVGAALVAMFLLVFLRSVVTTLDDAVNQVSADRIVTQSAVSLFINMPESYLVQIQDVQGVESVMRLQWFGGVYKDPENFFAQFAVDTELFLDQFEECVFVDGQPEDWVADRQGCIIGRALAEKHGLKIGDTVPLLGTIFVQPGLKAWEFNVRGIYRSTRANLDESTMWFHYDYLREALENGGAEGPGGVGVYYIKKQKGVPTSDVTKRVDALFELGPQRTLTQPESVFQASFVSMFGNLPDFLGWIGGAVLFALLLTIFNTMLISAAERIRDVGIMKALGFRDGTCARLYVLESMLLVALGGFTGIALAWFSVSSFRKSFGTSIPNYNVRVETVVFAAVLILVVGLVGGMIPAWKARKLEAAEALRGDI